MKFIPLRRVCRLGSLHQALGDAHPATGLEQKIRPVWGSDLVDDVGKSHGQLHIGRERELLCISIVDVTYVYTSHFVRKNSIVCIDFL